MRKLLFVFLAATVAVGLIAPMSNACGDKFLVSSRQVTQRDLNTYAGVILLYRTPETRAALDKDLKKSLENRGHTVEVVENAEDLQKQIKKGNVDLVMMGEEDAKTMGAQAEHPKVMPVARAGADILEINTLIEIYGFAVDSGAKTNKKTEEIDEAMKMVK